MLPKSIFACFLLSTTAFAQSCWRDLECTGPLEAAFPGPWDDNIYAPSSRKVSPASILSLETASVIASYPSQVTLQRNGTAFVYDFGKEVGGIVSVNYTTTGGPGSLGLAFTEAKNWIGLASDSSNGAFANGIGDQACNDGALYDHFSTPGNYSYQMDLPSLRGGFRYLTVFLLTNATTALTINDVILEVGYHPTWSNLKAYQGYFHSNDDVLNKIWYSGAYTLQTNYVPTDTGRWIPALHSGWANNGSLSNGTTVIVDGAKRDRAVWPGDMGIAVPSSFVSLGNDLDSVRNALQTMYDHQNSDGSFPEAGPPLLQQGSDTYHMWTMIGTYNYLLYTNDTDFLNLNWPRYEYAMKYVLAKILQPLGLLNVTGTRDWARQATSGNTTQANMILYRTLKTGADLFLWAGKQDLSKAYLDQATTLASNILAFTYDPVYGAFRDNSTNTTLYPQDGNSMALLFGLISPSSSEAQSISDRLTQNWTPIGAEAPELPHNISPFISSFEIQAHLTIGQTSRALELIRRSWGWYLAHPNGTQSTVIEGYLTNGSFAYRNYRGYDYDASYVSHAHGWSSGPTSALTEFVLGLSVVGRVGEQWKLAPQFGDLNSVEGGFVTVLGKFQAGWNTTDKGYSLWWNTPSGTSGEIILPLPDGEVGSTVYEGAKVAVNKRDHILMVEGGSGTLDVRTM